MKQTLYLDTSVISAYYDNRDPQRQILTQAFWKKLDSFDLFVSALVLTEIERNHLGLPQVPSVCSRPIDGVLPGVPDKSGDYKASSSGMAQMC